MSQDRIDDTQDWGGYVPRPAAAATLTLDSIPAVGKSPNPRWKSIEVPRWALRFGAVLLAAASLYGGAEAGARANFGRHAHEVLGDLVELGMADFGDQ